MKTKKLINAVESVQEAFSLLEEKERSLAGIFGEPGEQLDSALGELKGESENAKINALNDLVPPLWESRGTKTTDEILGRVLTEILKTERSHRARGKFVLERILGHEIAQEARKGDKRFLVINPHMAVTNVAYYEGTELIHDAILHLSPDDSDSVDYRCELIRNWAHQEGIDLKSFAGIACRGGFMKPVDSGTYEVVPQMLDDLRSAKIEHHSNLGIWIASRFAEDLGKDFLFTVSDPVVCDEVDLEERLTGYSAVIKDGTAAHYLNHKAVWRLLASILGKKPEELDLITAHLGAGISLAAHRDGRVASVVNAYSGVPSTNRCGQLDTDRILYHLKRQDFTLQDLEGAVYRKGGLLSLAGTDDFRALLSFLKRGASEVQCEKIQFLIRFLARKVSGGICNLAGQAGYAPLVAVTGSLARSRELVQAIRNNLNGRYAMVELPGNVENDALAAGVIRAYYQRDSLKDYVETREKIARERSKEAEFFSTPIFKRKLYYRNPGTPIVSLDDLIDATYMTVKERFDPTVAIVGAENEDAILAAKRANEEGRYRIAKFVLLGDYEAINRMAYDFDLILDGVNYRIVDTEDPVKAATDLMERGEVDVLMKGRMKTDQILRGVFRYLKSSGRLKKGQLISHCVVMDIPMRNKLLIVTDAAVNPYPDEKKKLAIVENALKVAKSLNVAQPKVAVISAIESVNPSVESSIEAARIAEKFADRKDCLVEGPLSFDVAMDPGIAAEKGYKGKIRGTADILLMPDIDAGNVLYKTLTTQTGAPCAGVILCGDMPMVLTSRGDSARSKLASISMAVKLMFDIQG